MASTGFRDQRKCFAMISRILENLTGEGIEMDWIVLEALKNYELSQEKIEKYIERFYINRGIIEFKNGRLYPVKVTK